jgi:alkane 1-monooxygenase
MLETETNKVPTGTAPDDQPKEQSREPNKVLTNPPLQFFQLKYSLIFLPLTLAVIGNLFGGTFSLLIIILIGVLIPLDYFLKFRNKTEIKDDRGISNWILYGVAGMQVVILLSFVIGIKFGIISGIWVLVSILGNGLATGIAVSAGSHELIHRRSDIEKLVGTIQLSLLGYSHHLIEHIQGHHRNVAMHKDPSSANKNQSVYNYFIHGVKQEFLDALEMEDQRCEKKNIGKRSFSNFVVKWGVITICIFVVLFLISPFVLLVYLGVVLIAMFFEYTVVYAQHYGLGREDGDRVSDVHSWQNDSLITEYFLLGFGRHSDHHTRVTKTYTEIIHKEDGPYLPFGYFCSSILALFPKAWFGYVNRLIK